MNKTGSFNIVLSLVMITAILSYPQSFSKFNNLNSEDNQKIEVCCTWGNGLNDAVLTYHTKNDNEEKGYIVTNSFDQWSSKLKNVKFKEVQDPSNAEVLVTFEHGGKETVGQTTSVLDEKGFIKRVKIRISINFNEEMINDETLGLVLKHEIGHALGLAHSNFHDLMNPIVNYQNKVITKCEISAVELANNWKLVENRHEPKLPKLPIKKTVDCDSEEM